MTIGYTAGVFDLLHIGHIRLLKEAKSLCDHLIVGITTDELCLQTKEKSPLFSFNERKETVESLKFADTVIAQHDLDKVEAWRRLKFNILFVGDDHYKEEQWIKYEYKLRNIGVETIFLPYTKGISSSKLRNLL